MKMFILCSRGSILGLGRKAKYIVESYRGNRRPWEFLLSYGSDKLQSINMEVTGKGKDS